MSLAIRKISFIQEFLKLENEVIINDFEKLLTIEKIKLHQNNLKPMSINELKSELQLSLDDSKKDKVFPNDELLKNIADW